MGDVPRSAPSRRDRAILRVRRLTWAVVAATAGLASALSVVAASAFKGHARQTAAAAPPATTTRAESRVRVPGPQYVPPIVGDDQPLQPPAAPPSQAPQASPPPAPAPAPAPAPQPQPQPQTSGGS